MTEAIIKGKESLELLDIESLTLNPKFGSLTFDNANKKLGKIRKWLIELEQLDYKNKLPENIVDRINQASQKFDEHVAWLEKFDIEISINPNQDHNNF